MVAVGRTSLPGAFLDQALEVYRASDEVDRVILKRAVTLIGTGQDPGYRDRSRCTSPVRPTSPTTSGLFNLL